MLSRSEASPRPPTPGPRPLAPDPHADLFALVIGIGAALTGLVILAMPGQFRAPIYDLARPVLPSFGVVFLGGGIALAAAQLRPLPPAAVRAVHLFVGGAFLAFLVGSWSLRNWTGIIYYGGFGLTIAALPWLGRRLDRVDPASLRTHIALALATAAAVPLIAAVAFHTIEEDEAVTAEALARQQTLAVALAESVADYVGLHRAAVTTVAGLAGLPRMAPEAQRNLLRAFGSAYPDVVAFSTYDAAGNPLARSDDRPLTSARGLPTLEEVRRTGAPFVDVHVSPLIGRPVFAIGVPMRDADGRLAGVAVGAFEAARLAELLARASADETGEVYLVDGRGRVIAHSEAALVAAFADRSRHPAVAALVAGGASGAVDATAFDGRLAGYARVPWLGWGVVVERPTTVALASLRIGRDATFGTLLLFIGLAVAVGSLVADRLAAPLAVLAHAAEKLATGFAGVPLPRSGISDVARLAAAFGEMRDRLAVRTAEREQAVAALHQSETKYRVLVEDLPAITYTAALDRTSSTLYISPQVESILGFSPAEWLADPELLAKRLHPEDRERVLGGFCCSRTDTAPYRCEYRLIARDGRALWFHDEARVVRDDAGRPLFQQGVMLDVTARKRAEAELSAQARRQAVVAGLGLRALGTTDLATLLDETVAVAAETLGVEYAKVLELRPGDRSLLLQAGIGWKPGLVGNTIVSALASPPLGQALPADGPAADGLPAETRVREQDLLRDHGVAGSLNVVIQGQARPFGVLGVHTTRRRLFMNDELHFLQSVANVLAMAFERQRAEEDRARLIREQASRAEAEAAQRRFAFLAEASALLASSLEVERTLAAVARLAVPFLADWCTANIFDEDRTLRQVQAAHVDLSKEELLREIRRRYPPGSTKPHPATRALETGQSEFYPELPDAVLAALAQDDEHLRILRSLGARSSMWVPLVARGRTLGVISLQLGESGRRFGPADLSLAEDLAARAALAVDNARLHRQTQESEARYRSLAVATSQIVGATNGEGEVVADSPSWRAFTGQSEDAIRGWGWLDAIHLDDRESVDRVAADAIAARRLFETEFRLRRADGVYRDCWMRGVPVLDDGGAIREWVGICSDVTERKQAEAARARLAAILEATTDYVGMADVDGRVLYLNRAARTMVGIAEDEEVVGTPLAALHPPDAGAAILGVGIPAAVRDGVWSGDTAVLSRDGRVIPLSQVIIAHRSSGGEVEYLSTIGRDMTEHRRAEEAVRAEHAFRQAIEDAMTAGVVAVDLEGRQTYTNPAFCKMVGWSQEELVGAMPPFVYWPPEERETITAVFQAHLAGVAVPGGSELRFRRRNEDRFDGLVLVSPLTDSQGAPTGWLASVYDITERKRVEEALRQANEQLAGWVEELEQRSREITLLSEMGDLLQACLSAEDAYNVVAHAAPQLFPGESGAVYVLSASRKILEAQAVWGPAPPEEHVFTPDACWALRRGQAHLVADPQSGLLCGHVSHPRLAGYLCVPMMAHGEALGMLHLQCMREGHDHSNDPPEMRDRLIEARQRLAVAAAEHVALALANLQLQETLRSQAIRDSLTALLNRRYMEESLEREVRRAVRKRTSLGVIMIDVDDFKQFNDLFGHAAGDVLLREMGDFLRTHVRAEDIACRYGGDEFTLILPEASPDVTRQRAERLREGIKHLHVQHRGQMLGIVTLSIGVAMFPAHGRTGDEVLHAADMALYRAKSEGRDQVRLAE